MKRAGTWAALLAAAGVAAGCGTTRVVLPAGNRMTPDEAVGVIERAARLNAEARVPAEAGAAEAAPAWADREGWFAWEEGRIIKLHYADIEAVFRTSARGDDVAASVCVLGLFGPFSAARVELQMKDGSIRRLDADPGADPAMCLNCFPFWLVTFPRPVFKTRAIGKAYEFMRVTAGAAALSAVE